MNGIEYKTIASGQFFDKLVILVDMDQTIAGFDYELMKRWKNRWPNIPIPDRSTYTYHNMEDYNRMQTIAGEEGFFESLPIYDGAYEKLNEWIKDPNIEVFLCTKPLDKRDPCVVEKYRWVENNLGFKWKDRVIITNDKTLCFGHILIDDVPIQKGVLSEPNWTHIYFDQKYNKVKMCDAFEPSNKIINVPDRPRIYNWNNVFIDITDSDVENKKIWNVKVKLSSRNDI